MAAILTTCEVAAKLHVGKDKIRDLVRQRRLPAVRLSSRGKLLFLASDVDELIREARESSIAASPVPQLA